MTSRLLLAARNAARASRASAAAFRIAATASRSGRLGAAGLGRDNTATIDLESCCQTKRRDDAHPFHIVDYLSSAEYKQLPDDVKFPTHKDLESDDATWAFYERWCKAFHKERDHAEMDRRFKLFKYYAKEVHRWNNHLPADPKKAAEYIKKRQKVKLLLSKGQDATDFDERYHPMELGPFADGGDPFITERNKRLLKALEERHAVQDVTA